MAVKSVHSFHFFRGSSAEACIIRFFERIAKTYRRENWGVMLRPLLQTWYACAQQMGDVELSVQLLVEMLAHGSADDEEESIAEDLLAVLKNTMPSNPDEPLVVDLTDARPIRAFIFQYLD